MNRQKLEQIKKHVYEKGLERGFKSGYGKGYKIGKEDTFDKIKFKILKLLEVKK